MAGRMTGEFRISTTAGEQVRAFVPEPLPPPNFAPSRQTQLALQRAALALGRLDSAASFLPDRQLLLYFYVRKEAVLSSQIEGTQSSLADLLMYEAGEAPGVPVDDVSEVSCYVRALEHGMRRLREGFPLSNRLLCEIHAELLASGRGEQLNRGEFRRSQNWIGGTRPGVAGFVPPPPEAVADCMAGLERFLHIDAQELGPLEKAALAHVQFETIHPFLDGNGRLGRLLIPLLLCHDGLLQEPTLYISLFLKTHRESYYRLLNEVRFADAWDDWLSFFADAIESAAGEAAATAQQLNDLARDDRAKIQAIGGQRAGSAMRVFEAMLARPLSHIPELTRSAGLAHNTVASALASLEEAGIVREISGKRRNRLFVYQEFLDTLNAGTVL